MTFIGVVVVGLAALILFALFSMVIVGGEQFGWWEWGWVTDPNDTTC